MGSHSVTSDKSEHTPPQPQASTRFTYPGGMEGWVGLGDLLHTEMDYPPADGHPSKYWPVSINYVDRSQCANPNTTPPYPKVDHRKGATKILLNCEVVYSAYTSPAAVPECAFVW